MRSSLLSPVPSRHPAAAPSTAEPANSMQFANPVVPEVYRHTSVSGAISGPSTRSSGSLTVIASAVSASTRLGTPVSARSCRTRSTPQLRIAAFNSTAPQPGSKSSGTPPSRRMARNAVT